jgi:enoyl-CoA hydratase
MNEILLQRSGRLLRITLNRPEQRNAIDRATDAALRAAWAAFAADDGLDVAILTGAGDDAFCAGADLRDYIPRFLNADMGVVRDNIATGLGGLTRGMPMLTKPVIAAVNGWALAGGFELALACDIRIASTTARFGSFEIHRGFHHGDGGIVRLIASLGLSRTMDIVLSGRIVDATEAERIGLVHQRVPPERLLTAAETYAADLLGRSQRALRSAKQTMLEVIGRSLEDALRLEALYGYSSGDPADIRTRLASFFARSNPDPNPDPDPDPDPS